MTSQPRAFTVRGSVGLACAVACCVRPPPTSPLPTISGHPVQVDAARKLLPWTTAGRSRPTSSAAYARVVKLAWSTLESKFPAQDNGLPTWLTYSRFDPDTFEGIAWPHNPAGLYAMLTESAVLWYAFSGDSAAVAVTRTALDYQIVHGSTPADWDWARVPYASAGAGDVEYRGADDEWCDYCGRGDGIGVIEPDKVGELGFAYVQMYELTRETHYAEAAVACADALASHVRRGDEQRSPWPFRVYALTNVAREEYSSNVIGALMLFDELSRLSLGNVDSYARARAIALEWLMRVPMQNDAWSGYFEDVAIQPDPLANPSQYPALRTARWLIGHPDADPRWRAHVEHLLAWAARSFGGDTAVERGMQWGATVMSEQAADMTKMGSHTARFGATLALWAQATGDGPARERAARSLNWATYMCREDGIVAVGENTNEGWWFSDGYGDYIRHFLVAMGAEPEWAPAHENHIVRSTSVVTHVVYEPQRVAWSTFDADSTETLRLTSLPAKVLVDGVPLLPADFTPNQWFDVRALPSGGAVVRVRHRRPGGIAVALDEAG
ncbi:MAG TPA: hypothetical protein VEK07_19205 [Polyangiaceae bacterium]|nr:hypothetical protein [Polyangiaceae bacterium]